ncbi:MAG: PH domain-containing protein [Candidatus Saccharimonas sp.]
MQEQQEQESSQKPVAYDVDGNPLYAAPVVSDAQARPQVVHMTRAFEPVEVELSPEARQKHDESTNQYPGLNLSEHEYVISDVRRHPIGLLAPIIVTTILVTVAFLLALDYQYVAELLGLSAQSYAGIVLIGILFAVLSLIGGYLAIWVYTNNRFYLTNESVIQEIQNSIFSKNEQIASLMNIEDASFSQRGPLQVLLDYGSIRLSTEGSESTYRFDYVQKPKQQIAILNNAVEAFKNGRPVQPSVTSEN